MSDDVEELDKAVIRMFLLLRNIQDKYEKDEFLVSDIKEIEFITLELISLNSKLYKKLQLMNQKMRLLDWSFGGGIQ